MNEDDDDIWDKAIRNAVKAFKDTFDEEDLDATYWTIKIISHSMSSGFDGILETKPWDEYGNYELKEFMTI